MEQGPEREVSNCSNEVHSPIQPHCQQYLNTSNAIPSPPSSSSTRDDFNDFNHIVGYPPPDYPAILSSFGNEEGYYHQFYQQDAATHHSIPAQSAHTCIFNLQDTSLYWKIHIKNKFETLTLCLSIEKVSDTEAAPVNVDKIQYQHHESFCNWNGVQIQGKEVANVWSSRRKSSYFQPRKKILRTALNLYHRFCGYYKCPESILWFYTS